MLHHVVSFLTAEIKTTVPERLRWTCKSSQPSAHIGACYFRFNSPPTIIHSLDIPKMSEGGVSATFDSPPSTRKKACITLHVRVDTLNFGTGRSVSLYLVQRRAILGSRTMSTGGIPGFYGRGRWRHNTVIHPTTSHGENLLQSSFTQTRHAV